jgi:hypothetical protein
MVKKAPLRAWSTAILRTSVGRSRSYAGPTRFFPSLLTRLRSKFQKVLSRIGSVQPRLAGGPAGPLRSLIRWVGMATRFLYGRKTAFSRTLVPRIGSLPEPIMPVNQSKGYLHRIRQQAKPDHQSSLLIGSFTVFPSGIIRLPFPL